MNAAVDTISLDITPQTKRDTRRDFLPAAINVFMSGVFAAPGFARDKPLNYPTRPVRMVIGTTPGGALDGLTRLAAQKFGERFGHTAIVDNRPGAGTMLAMEVVAAAQADGYTLLCASETLLLLGATRRTRYDVRKAFTPVELRAKFEREFVDMKKAVRGAKILL